jgi:ribonucleases P/MRP protein subunit RPP40
VLKVTEDIRLSMEDEQVTVLLLLDFSQAFDMVVHGLLLCKLQNAQNYSFGAGMLVGSYLGERAQFVRSSGQESSVGAVTCGVPQGSVLGPLLLISYIDDVSRVIRYCGFHIHADDLQIYHTCAVSHFQRCIDELNFDLQRVHEWAAANGLKVNPIKSRCRVDIPPLTLLIGSDVIKIVPKVNNIGLVLNERLTATDHFKKVCQKVYWILRSLRPHAHRLKLGGGWLRHLLCLTLDMGVLCMLVRMLCHNGG